MRVRGCSARESILYQEEQLLYLRVLTIGPLVHFRAELDEFAYCFLKNVVIIDLYQERQLRSASNRCNLELRSEVLLFAAHLNEQFLDLLKDELFLSLRAIELVLVFLTELRNGHAEGWILNHLQIHDLFDLRLIQVQKQQELLGKEALLLITARAMPIVPHVGIFLGSYHFREGSVTFLSAELDLGLSILYAALLFLGIGRVRLRFIIAKKELDLAIASQTV